MLSPDAAGIEEAARLLREGAVIAFPTDTVYGLAALATDVAAQWRIYDIKHRPQELPLILMLATAADLEQWAELDEVGRAFAEKWWPGAVTLVLPARPVAKPPLAHGTPPTVGARVPAHPISLALLEAVGTPLATTSANRSGQGPATNAAEAAIDGVDAVLNGGRAAGGVASTVVDLTGERPRVLREGAVSSTELLGN